MEKRKKRMAFVDLSDFSGWPMGGMLRYEMQILETLTKCYQVDLWGVSVNGREAQPVSIGERQYQIHNFAKVRTHRRIIPNYWKGMALIRYCRKFREYDIVYVHTGSCMAALWFLRRKGRPLLVYHQHGLQYLEDYSLKTLLQRPFMYIAQRMADFTFVVTGKRELEEYLCGSREKLRSKLVSIGSPIGNRTEILKTRKNGYTFLYAGRMAPIKRVPLLIEAFALFCRNYTDEVRLILIGDGEDMPKVKNAVRGYHLEKQILLTGILDKEEIRNYLHQSDAYVTASAGEGVSVAVLEAFAEGIPVACFSVRGLAEQVEHEKTGILAQGDTAVHLAQAMEALYRKSDCFQRACLEESKKYAKELIGKQIIEEMEKRYEIKYHHTGI